MRGGAHSPTFRAAPGRGCNPTVKDSWQTQCQELDCDMWPLKTSLIFMERKKKFTHAQQTDAAPTNDWRQRQCDNSQCYLMVTIWKHPERSGKYISHTFTFTKWSKHTSNRDTVNNSQNHHRINDQYMFICINTSRRNQCPRFCELFETVFSTYDIRMRYCFQLYNLYVSIFTEKAVQKTHISIDICMRVNIKIPATSITDASSCSFSLVILQEMDSQMKRGLLLL